MIGVHSVILFVCSLLYAQQRVLLSHEEPPDLSYFSAEYHDLGEVFSKDCALSLPPHRPYDCAIDPLLGAPSPSRHHYNLSRQDGEAIER